MINWPWVENAEKKRVKSLFYFSCRRVFICRLQAVQSHFLWICGVLLFSDVLISWNMHTFGKNYFVSVSASSCTQNMWKGMPLIWSPFFLPWTKDNCITRARNGEIQGGFLFSLNIYVPSLYIQKVVLQLQFLRKVWLFLVTADKTTLV